MIGTALAIGLAATTAASAGAQIYGAKKASDASKSAAKIQTGAIDKAQKIQDDTYAPYLSQARTANGTLGRLVTPSAGARYATPSPAPQPTPGVGLGAGSGNRPRPPAAPTTGPAVPRAGGGMVMLEAPDGSGARPVPADQVDRFLAMGATRVN